MSAKTSPDVAPGTQQVEPRRMSADVNPLFSMNPLHAHASGDGASTSPWKPKGADGEVQLELQGPSNPLQEQPHKQQHHQHQQQQQRQEKDTERGDVGIEPCDGSSAGGLGRSPSGERQWRLDYSQFAAARMNPEAARSSAGNRWLLSGRRSDPVMGYYRRQNEMIDGFSEMDALGEHLLPPTRAEVAEAEKLARGEQLAIHLSNVLNILLLLAKILASVLSHSLSIIASTLDSLLDCLSGFILWYTARSMQRQNPYKYPIGKKRMQPLGIIVFACIMAMLGLQILVEAVRQFFDSSHKAGLGKQWQVYVAIMLLAIVTKLGLYLYCRSFDNEIVQAYAQDHFFDVVTNVIGLGAALLAGALAWWIDPLGAILLSFYTMINWGRTVYENVRSLTGQTAPPEYLQKLTYLCWNHHEAIRMIDTVRAYTFGSSYFTEVDVVLPRDMPLQEAHDIGESLQNKLESLPEIERAFVHLDYEVSHRPEHHAHAHFRAPPGGPSLGGTHELAGSP